LSKGSNAHVAAQSPCSRKPGVVTIHGRRATHASHPSDRCRTRATKEARRPCARKGFPSNTGTSVVILIALSAPALKYTRARCAPRAGLDRLLGADFPVLTRGLMQLRSVPFHRQTPGTASARNLIGDPSIARRLRAGWVCGVVAAASICALAGGSRGFYGAIAERPSSMTWSVHESGPVWVMSLPSPRGWDCNREEEIARLMGPHRSKEEGGDRARFAPILPPGIDENNRPWLGLHRTTAAGKSAISP